MMWRQIVVGIGCLGLALVGLWGLFTVAMRTKFRPVQDGIRRMNRAVINPRNMATAGTPGAYASLLHHVGRTTGTAYRTPVVARPTDDGFVIVLPYGTRADWLKNVLAAGSAVIVREGATHRVDRPQLQRTAAADRYFTPAERRNHRLYGVDDALVVRRVDQP